MSPARSRQLTIASDASAPAQARRAVQAFLAETPVVEKATLVTSELVTNAVVHGCSKPIDLAVRVFDGFARIEVASRSAMDRTALSVRQAGNRRGGFGLGVVDRLADDWGIDDASRDHRPVTVVWSEFALKPRRSLP